jgi:hypothetical protein
MLVFPVGWHLYPARSTAWVYQQKRQYRHQVSLTGDEIATPHLSCGQLAFEGSDILFIWF